MNNINSYNLSRAWFDFCFENPEKIKPNHTAMYFFAIEHCNRLGWKQKFGFPTTMVMEAISIKSYKTYISTLLELVEFGFIKMIERSKNQHSSNIIELVIYTKADAKALDKALIKHTSKQVQSTIESVDSIIKQINNKQFNNKQINKLKIFIDDYLKPDKEEIPTFEIFKDYAISKEPFIEIKSLKLKYDSWVVNDWKDGHDKKIKNWKSKILNTIPFLNKINNSDIKILAKDKPGYDPMRAKTS